MLTVHLTVCSWLALYQSHYSPPSPPSPHTHPLMAPGDHVIGRGKSEEVKLDLLQLVPGRLNLRPFSYVLMWLKPCQHERDTNHAE